MGILNRIDSLVPRWMTEAPRRAFGLLMAAPAMIVDGMFAEYVNQARLAAMPGQVMAPGIGGLGGFDNVDALPLIARDRLVFPGLTEPPWALAARLRSYLDDWAVSGSAYGILNELAAVMAPNPPMMRIVTTGGQWTTRDSDGTIHFQTTAGVGFNLAPNGISSPNTTVTVGWGWDGSTLPPPPDQGDNARGFLIIYPPASSPYLTTDDQTFADDGQAGDAWNNPDVNLDGGTPFPGHDAPLAGTCGTNSPVQFVELVRGVIRQRECAGFRMAWVIIAFNSGAFSPDGSSSTTAAGSEYPDGNWGYPTKYDAGTNSQIVSRNTTAEYWPGNPGGILPDQG